tara:strand:- start:246 stop:548 length:303 start_codon:yes stop_codon:yes gene_type:complete
MIDYNNLFRIAREQFWQFRPSEDTFEIWAQKHTVIDHVGQALLVRLDIDVQTEDESVVEFHDEIWIIDNSGAILLLNDNNDVRDFEELLEIALNERQGGY